MPSISRSPWPDNQTLYGGEGTLLTVEANGRLPLHFEWLHNDSPILDATNSLLKIMHLQTNHSGAYRTIISNSAGSVTTSVATINVLPPVPLDAALDISNTTWVTGGDSPWFGVGNVSTNNNASARNGNILAGESSWVETTFIGPGVLTFDYYGRDVFEARFLTVTFAGMTMNLSRDPGTSWNTSQYRLPYGPQTCRWTYYHYDTNSSGLEGVWLDNVRFDADPPGPPAFVKQPISVELFEGHTGTVSCVITGSYPASFQWFFNSNAMLNATNMDLILENVGAPQEGKYWVVVSNAYGVTTSSTSTVSVTTSEKVSAALGVTGWTWISGGTAPPWRIVAVS
ncbi:MAG: immunoglobulin domain-containing protein, partial [Saprospiraceae bacterium]|nr:immunoglobulin domain-containing protein [Saprospiraceae bacterium]